MRRALVLGAIGAALAPGLLPLPARAHAALVGSTPARRAVVTIVPPRVELRFSERLEPAFSSLSVRDAAGRQVDLRDARLGIDAKSISVGVPSLPPGVYSVQFRVVSVDAHVTEASFPFTVSVSRRY
jgi:methionine-rich copper-binding protein CopC